MPAPNTRADDLFQQAAEIPPQERAAFLTRACAGDPTLRKEVYELLAAFDWMDDFATAPPGHPDPPETELAGTVLAGRYTLTRRIGQGGMGSVWEADQTDPVKRQVAVKLVRLERGLSQTLLARFAAEQQAIALMDHPHIARLFDAGGTPDGQPFFAMEYVRGVPLHRYCEAHTLSVPDRLRLFAAICQAVQHAHQKGVIHRDLKPGNILVEEHDGRPVPKVIDFGLAKAAAGGGVRLTDATLHTGVGGLLGTPLYMAPEQARFDAVDVDTRADVYALGVILYELLAGNTPIPREKASALPLDELLRRVREDDPPPPTARTPDRLPNARELDWVVLKALAKERERRYDSPGGLARDVERFLANEPVAAGPPTAGYKVRKFVQRHRVPVVAAGVVLLALVGGIIGTTWGLLLAEERRKEAEANATKEAEQRGIAEANEDRAVKSAAAERKAKDRAADVLDLMVSEVTGRSLVTQVTINEAQQKFLAEVLTYYEELAAGREGDEATRARAARAAQKVGLIHYRLKHATEALAAFRAAQKQFAALHADFPEVLDYRRGLGRSHSDLGNMHESLKAFRAAADEYATALAIRKRVVELSPNVPAYRQELACTHNDSGQVLEMLEKWEQALAEYETALGIQKELADEHPEEAEHWHGLAWIYSNLTSVYIRTNQPAKAAAECQRAVAVRERLGREHPFDANVRRALADSVTQLAQLHDAEKRPDDAMREYERAVGILEGLVADFPAQPDYRGMVATARHTLAEQWEKRQEWGKSRDEYLRAVTLRKQLGDTYPTYTEYRRGLSFSYFKLAWVYLDLKQPKETEKCLREAVKVLQSLAADYPNVAQHQWELGAGYNSLGNWVRDANPTESVGWCDKAVATLRPVCEADAANAIAKAGLRNATQNRAKARERLGEYEKAIPDWDEAIALSTKEEAIPLRADRVYSLLGCGRAVDAVAETAELRKLDGWASYRWVDFACVYAAASVKVPELKAEYCDRAVALLRRAEKEGYRGVDVLRKSKHLDPLRDRADFKDLVADLEKKYPPKKETLPPPRPSK